MLEGDLNFAIAQLGQCRFPSPLSGVRFTCDDERVLFHARLEDIKLWIAERADPPAMEAAFAFLFPFLSVFLRYEFVPLDRCLIVIAMFFRALR